MLPTRYKPFFLLILSLFVLWLSACIGDEPATESAPAATAMPKTEAVDTVAPSHDRFKTVSSGYEHTCGLLEDGSAVCWGSDSRGQSSPPDGRFKAVSSGRWHTCGLLEDGSAVCWGSDSQGQSSPPDGHFKTVSNGYEHTCGLLEDGSAVCWGSDSQGQSSPPDGRFKTVSSGRWHTCGLLEDGSVVCWGLDNYGQSSPPDGRFKAVSSGGNNSCSISESNTLSCWGYIGSVSQHSEYIAVDVGYMSDVCVVSVEGVAECWYSPGHTDERVCRTDLNEEIECWSSSGEPLHYRFSNQPLPEEKFIAVSAGWQHACGIREDASVRCWGADNLEQSTPETRTRPLPPSLHIGVCAVGHIIKKGMSCDLLKVFNRPVRFAVNMEGHAEFYNEKGHLFKSEEKIINDRVAVINGDEKIYDIFIAHPQEDGSWWIKGMWD